MRKFLHSNQAIKSLIKAKILPFSESPKPTPVGSEELEKAKEAVIRSQNKDFDKITIQKRPTKLPLADTQVKKDSDFYDPKKGPFRETQHVFNF